MSALLKAALIIGVYRYLVFVEIVRTVFNEIGIIVKTVHCDEYGSGWASSTLGLPGPQRQIGPVIGDKGCFLQLRLRQTRALRGCKIRCAA